MALINTLRNKMGKVVVVAIAVAIMSFVLADLLGPNSMLLGGNNNVVGEIAGEEIDAQVYSQRVDMLKTRYGNPAESQMLYIRNAAWDGMISEIAFKPEFEVLGLDVPDDELVDMVQGRNIDPGLRQQFTNPETGEYDVDQVIAILQSYSGLPAQQQAQWYNFEKDLRQGRLRVKYDNLLSLSNYVTTDEAKLLYESQTEIAEVKYVYVPYYSVDDSLINVTDNQLKTYLNEHKDDYKVEASKSINFVSFPILPSGTDSTTFLSDLDVLEEEFKSRKDDSIFAKINTDGNVFFNTYSLAQLPNLLQINATSLEQGEVYGPYYEAGMYRLYKVSQVFEDTVYAAKVSHILFKGEDDSDEEKQKAKQLGEQVLREIKNGADFAEKAKEYSKDPSNASKGGELGWGVQGSTWVPEFEDAVFARTSSGLVNNLVETDYGYHIIYVSEPKTNKSFKIASIAQEMIASQETREIAYRKADLFAFNSGNIDEFKSNAESGGLTIQSAEEVDKNARSISNISNAREVVRWMYNEANIGQISGVFELDEYYVVAILTGETEKGNAQLKNIRDELTIKVKNELKFKIISEKLSSYSGSLEEIKESYGSDASIHNSSDLKLTTNSLPGVGYAPAAIGHAFALDQGQKTQPLEADNGVLIIELINKTGAPEIADYTSYKNQKIQAENARVSINVMESIKEFADIEDLRFKFY